MCTDSPAELGVIVTSFTPGPVHCTAGAVVLCVSLAVGASCYEAPPGSEGQGSQLQQGTAAANLCLEIRPTQLRVFVRLEESRDLVQISTSYPSYVIFLGSVPCQ